MCIEYGQERVVTIDKGAMGVYHNITQELITKGIAPFKLLDIVLENKEGNKLEANEIDLKYAKNILLNKEQ